MKSYFIYGSSVDGFRQRFYQRGFRGQNVPPREKTILRTLIFLNPQ
jgi:hypothetical protein